MADILPEDIDLYFKKSLVFLYQNFTKHSHNEEKNKVLREEFNNIIYLIKQKTEKIHSNNELEKSQKFAYFYELMMFFRLIMNVRDFEYGKGERYYTYMMLDILYKYYPELAMAGIELILGIYSPKNTDYFGENRSLFAFGCWKDVQYLCDYIRFNNQNNISYPFIEYCVYITVIQLEKDWKIILEHREDLKKMRKNVMKPISQCAKWIPRENKSKGWLFKKMAILWNYRNSPTPYVCENTMSEKTHPKAYNKCFMEFRKIISAICSHLSIVERKICDGKWSQINLTDINIDTRCRFSEIFCGSFLLKSGKNLRLHPRENMVDEIKNVGLRYKNIPLSFFVREGIKCISSDGVDKKYENEINESWNKYLNNYFTLDNVVPILDISIELFNTENELYWEAIGLACLISEKSTINKRIVLVNDKNNIWINLSDCKNFISILRRLTKYTNISCFKTNSSGDLLVNKFRQILDSMIYVGMSDRNIEKMNFFIIQNNSQIKMQHKKIRKMFIDPQWSLNIPMPHFFYWNLSENIIDYDDIICDEEHVTLLSGYNPRVLNIIGLLGMERVKKQIPYDMINNFLFDNRYAIAEKSFIDVMANYL
jgi:hypothetical protein